MNPRERLQYALYLQRLHDLFVIKENIAFEYQHKNYNKAAKQIDIAVDKMLHDNVVNAVDGTVSLKDPKLDHIIEEALTGQQNMLVKNPDHYIRNAVDQDTKQFSNFLQNRIEKENYSLQKKIQEEYDKRKNEKISDEQLKKEIKEKYSEHGRKRAKNIVKDALHTNQAHMSWVSSREGYKYKVWMNGQSKSGVRSWHIKSKIQPVEIDDFFDIFGPTGHASMMYPGDLNGGAENVANCKCWLYYTNIAPSNLKPRGTIQVNPNVQLGNENAKTFSPNTQTKGKSRKPRVSESTSNNKKEGLFTRIRNMASNIKNSLFPNKKYNKDPNKVVDLNGKKVYGVGESLEDKEAFLNKWSIKESELTKQELNFVKLYSAEGSDILNEYLRDIANEPNEFLKQISYMKYLNKWEKLNKMYPEYKMSFSGALRVSETIFEKGKILDEDLVLIRRQSSPLSKYSNDGIYHSDGFLSTSISQNVKPEIYGDYVHKLVIPKGTKIFYIERITSTRRDYEVLFNRGTELKFHNQENEYVSSWILI